MASRHDAHRFSAPSDGCQRQRDHEGSGSGDCDAAAAQRRRRTRRRITVQWLVNRPEHGEQAEQD